jgi:hypothetical protein
MNTNLRESTLDHPPAHSALQATKCENGAKIARLLQRDAFARQKVEQRHAEREAESATVRTMQPLPKEDLLELLQSHVRILSVVTEPIRQYARLRPTKNLTFETREIVCISQTQLSTLRLLWAVVSKMGLMTMNTLALANLTPVIGRQSTMLKPDSVSLVIAPMITMPNTSAAHVKSQAETALSCACGGASKFESAAVVAVAVLSQRCCVKLGDNVLT